MIRITSFSSNKEKGKNNNGFANTPVNITTVNSGVVGVNIWGQYHDHTKDISGDMSNVGNISADGNINTTSDISARNITATGNATSNKVITGDVNSTGNITNTGDITTDGTITATGRIKTDSYISAESGYFSTELITEDFEASTANIGNLTANNITTDILTVTKAAHFYKLVIDEIKATQGQIIVTPANAEITKVEQNGNKYILYFPCINPLTREKITNNFYNDDQIVCQTFNVAEGTTYDADNKFYWARCTRVSQRPAEIQVEGQGAQTCHWIELDWTDKDPATNSVPEAGDEIVALGNRSYRTRQSAISIGAYNNPYLDNTIQAPFIIQYDGINDYDLSSHRVNVISKGYNYFKGEFYTSTGDDIEELINDVAAGTTAYLHTAYANSPDGQTNFSKTYFANAQYIGFCSNHTQSDTGLTYQDYTWARLRGENGTSASNYILTADSLSVHVKEDNTTTDEDFYIRGFQFDSNGKSEVHNRCQYTYIYETPSLNYTRNGNLPLFLSPQQDTQAYENGLKTIRYQMWNGGESDFLCQLDIPIIRDGQSGSDMEQYKLVPIAETVPIDKNGTLGIQLQYNIVHLVGSNFNNVSATSSLCVYFKPHYEQSVGNYTALSINTTTPSYTNAQYQQNWDTSSNKLQYLEIVLANQNPSSSSAKVYDKRVVYAALAPSATFQITDEIKSVVQGHTTSINGLTNSISTINQQFNQISSTVESHTTQINNIDGRVTTNETNISNITQKADSIESTVQNLKTGAKNLFNFTQCLWYNCVPFIQAYGIEGKGTLNRITNLGFDGIGGDFAVTCKMKMKTTNTNVNVNICDTNDLNQPTVRVTTEWNSYQFVIKNVNRYIGNVADTGGYNGFIDFESSDISNTNRLYVKDLMIVRGNIPSDFNYSWKDYENVNTDNIIDWSYDANIAATDERYKGYVVYKPTEYNTDDESYTDFIFANNKSLKTNTPYTLSFYAKCENPCVIQAFLYGNGGCVDGTCGMINTIDKEGEITISNLNDGVTSMRVGTHWKQFIIHWYNQNSGNRNIIAYRDSADNWDYIDTTPNLSICGVEFHEGYWDKDLLNSQSLIRQTATEIEMKVNNTGINIYDGSITLNAENTTINGNLNLKDTKQGLIIYDQYDNPKITIQNETLGTLNNFDFGADKNYKQTTSTKVITQTYNVNFEPITLGNYAAGQKLEIHNITVNTFNNQFPFDTTLSRLSYYYTIKCGNVTVATQNGNATYDRYEYSIPDYVNNQLSQSGTYTITLSFSGILSTTDLYGEFTHRLYLYARTIQPSINKIATDGAVFSSSVDKFNWFGSDQTVLRNGASAIRLKDGHLERNEYNSTHPIYSDNFSDISTTMPYSIINSLSYTATLNDGFITFSTVINQDDDAQRKLYLPLPSTCAGKKYYIKNKVGSDTQIYVGGASASDNYFIEHNSNERVNTINIDSHSTILISDGFNWMEFYC